MTGLDVRKMEQEKDIDGLFKALDDPSRFTRSDACRVIIKIGDAKTKERLLDHLIKILSSKDWAEVQGAVIDLGELKDKKSVEPLIQVLSHNMSMVVMHAAKVLGMIGDGRAVDALISLLEHYDHLVRIEAIRALAQIGDKKASNVLIERLKMPDMDVVELGHIVQALGQLREARAVHSLVALLKHEHNYVRGSAAFALSIDEIAAELTDKEPAIESLLEMLREKISDQRISACLALGTLGDESVIPALEQVRQTDEWAVKDMDEIKPPRYEVREAAYQAIQQIRQRLGL